jgi:leader peptidase (prepilin peptidase)/N-methyltransferase
MHAFWIFFLFLFGAATGSFLNVVIYRMPRGESINFPRSHCTVCGKMIAFYDNLPILSWLLLRGRCRHCKTRISPRYLIIEALTGLMFVGLYVAYFVLDVRQGSGTFEQSYAM